MHLTDDPAIAARALMDGGLAVLPTETVYGLGARADLPHAIARIYAAKGRPADHPLIVHILESTGLDDWGVDVPDYARALGAAYWPGPLTLVVARSPRAGDYITGGQDTVAIRVPVHSAMREVLRALTLLTDDPSIGIAAPSANRFGRVSPTTVAHVIDELARVLADSDVVLDGGASEVGVESTIVDCTGSTPAILRPGRISRDDVERVTGLVVAKSSTVRAPGTLDSHYAPHARVLIVDSAGLAQPWASDATIGLLALDAVPTPVGLVRLSEPQSADDYARVLYAALREADALGLATVLAVPPPSAGVGAAVLDRLRRAATSAAS